MVGPDGLLVPPGRSFSMIVNAATKIFSHRFDEAMRDNFVNARAMRRDAFLRGLFEERILPTINREWILEVDDDRDPEQSYVRDQLTKVVKKIKDFDAFKRANLDAVWFGRAGCQWSYGRQDEADNQWGLTKWDPLHGDSIQFTFEGVPAVLLDMMSVGWYASHGATQGPNGDLRPTDRGGTALVLQRPYWRNRFSVHVHMREKADYFEGELAGSVQGLGLRGLVYWQYVVRTDALTWMLAYMQAVGQMDLLVFNYPAGNNEAKLQQEANAQKIIGKAAIACPRNPTGNWPAIEQIQMNAAGLKALHDLVADYFDRHIERLFVGQSMSSGADKGDGLGGTGRSEFAKATKDEILVYDTTRLDSTFTSDLILPLKRYNFPWAKFPIRFKSIIPNLKAEEKVQSGLSIAAAGVEIKKDELREAAGYSRPEEGDETVGGMQPGMGGPGMEGGAPPMSAPPGAGPPGLPGAPPPMQWQPGAAAQASTAAMAGMGPGGGPGGPPTGPMGPPPGPPTPFSSIPQLPPGRTGVPIRLADMPPVSGPVMGSPGGSNTYLPKFGSPKFGDKRKWHEGKPLQDLIGFTRYTSPYLPLEYQAGPHKFSSTHVRLTGEAAIRILAMGGLIRDEDLADDGREDEPHVTLLYGLHGRDPVPAGELLAGSGPVRMKLGKVSFFPGGEDKDYDVLKVDVDSKDLIWLNRRLKKLPSTETFKYNPHATIAYVKKGLGKKYADAFGPLNIEVEATGVVFSDPSHQQTWLPVVSGGEEIHPPVEYARPPAEYVTDSLGLEHKEKGSSEGGQFTSKGGGGNGASSGGAGVLPTQSGPKISPVDCRSRGSFEQSVMTAYSQSPHAKAVKDTIGRISDTTIQRLAKTGGMRRVVSYDTPQEVTRTWQDLERRDGNPKKAKELCGGFYDHETGDVHSDGGDPAGTLAHEIGHAIDFDGMHGPYYHSSSDEFRYCWSQELKRGQLTEYAASNPSEGFAEFVRWMYTNYSDSNPNWPAEVFPLTYGYFTRHGLI